MGGQFLVLEKAIRRKIMQQDGQSPKMKAMILRKTNPRVLLQHLSRNQERAPLEQICRLRMMPGSLRWTNFFFKRVLGKTVALLRVSPAWRLFGPVAGVPPDQSFCPAVQPRCDVSALRTAKKFSAKTEGRR